MQIRIRLQKKLPGGLGLLSREIPWSDLGVPLLDVFPRGLGLLRSTISQLSLAGLLSLGDTGDQTSGDLGVELLSPTACPRFQSSVLSALLEP